MNTQSFSQSPDHAVRQEQAAFAREQAGEAPRRPTLSVVRNNPVQGLGLVKKDSSAPKGHEAFLKGLENSRVDVVFEKMSSGEKITGVVKTSDKYTISVVQPLEGGRYVTRVLFKHDISEFTPLVPAVAPLLAAAKVA